MDTTHDGSEYTRPVDRAEAARLLADAESGTPVASPRDVRRWAALCAGIGLTMAVFAVLCRVSVFFVLPYALVITGLVLWQRATVTTTPRGVSRLYTWGVACSSIVLGVFFALLAFVWGDPADAPVWVSVLGGVAIAAPMLVAAALIARKAGR